MLRHSRVLLCSALVLSLVDAAGAAAAATLTFDTSQGPFLEGSLNHGAWNTNFAVPDSSNLYRVGFWFIESPAPPTIPGQAEIRSFWTFDLRGLDLTDQRITSATLRLVEEETFSSGATETVGFYDVTTPALEVNTQDRLPPPALFADLGSGNLYGELTFPVRSPATPENILEVSLTDIALADIAASAGDYFTIGSRLLSFSGDPAVGGVAAMIGGAPGFLEAVFNGPRTTLPQELVITVEAVPEPATFGLLGAGLLGLATMCRRRR